MKEYMRREIEWLTRRARAAEAKDPALRPLKDRINELQKEIMDAVLEDEPEKLDPPPGLEERIVNLIRQQNEAIKKLLDHIQGYRS